MLALLLELSYKDSDYLGLGWCQPEALGFQNMNRVARNRLIWKILKRKGKAQKSLLAPGNCFFSRRSRTKFSSSHTLCLATFQQSVREFSRSFLWFAFSVPDRQALLVHQQSPRGSILKGKTTMLPNKLSLLHTYALFWLKTSSFAIKLTKSNWKLNESFLAKQVSFIVWNLIFRWFVILSLLVSP